MGRLVKIHPAFLRVNISVAESKPQIEQALDQVREKLRRYEMAESSGNWMQYKGQPHSPSNSPAVRFRSDSFPSAYHVAMYI